MTLNFGGSNIANTTFLIHGTSGFKYQSKLFPGLWQDRFLFRLVWLVALIESYCYFT
jgi:hypothetical protein